MVVVTGTPPGDPSGEFDQQPQQNSPNGLHHGQMSGFVCEQYLHFSTVPATPLIVTSITPGPPFGSITSPLDIYHPTEAATF
jgi:hypothetical protein